MTTVDARTDDAGARPQAALPLAGPGHDARAGRPRRCSSTGCRSSGARSTPPRRVANFVKEVRLRADRGMIKDRARHHPGGQPPVVRRLHHPGLLPRTAASEVLPQLAELLGLGRRAAQEGGREQLVRAGTPQRAVPADAGAHRSDPRRAATCSARARGHLRRRGGGAACRTATTARSTVLSHVLGYMNEITQEELERLNARRRERYALGDYIGRRGAGALLRVEAARRGRRAQGSGERARRDDPELNDKLGENAVVPPQAGQQRGAVHRHAPAGGGRARLPGRGGRGGGHRRAAPASSARWCRGPASTPTCSPAA